MYEIEEGVFEVYSGARRLRLSESSPANESAPKEITVFCSKDEFEGFWKHFFDLETDYAKIVSRAAESGNRFLSESAKIYGDIRVLHQDLYEMLISFIISQQKQIPSIRKCVEALCERYGRTMEDRFGTYKAFPEPEAIAEGGIEGLAGLSLGYRDRYIYESSVRYLREGLSKESFAGMSYPEAKTRLKTYEGVGEKVANCICLFGLHMVSAFPVDTHVKDILYREFYRGEQPFEKLSDKDYVRILEEELGEFVEVQGILQQWMFANEIGTKR